MNFKLRRLHANLLIRFPKGQGFTTVYNARKGYTNLSDYRALEAAGKLEITSTHNATTENMLYGMTSIHFTLKD